MNKKIVIVAIVVIVGFITFDWITGFSDEDEKSNNVVFHITLANPELYSNGSYSDKFSLDSGTYFFRFVPNGSSPETLSIKLTGQNYEFIENFNLIGTSHESEIAKYFTWKYEGKKNITISSLQEISIIINPNGNVMGSVSVDLIKK
ncbi:hypothetical protein OAU20_02240 [Nitrosopumilus sp.]|nr:hypothetical protein [Nitrosopumilus sp.]|tara:strand:+ start:87 stop:527 length:441 start_codon:yes stop_codon:yes gene_type:complete